MTIRQEMLRAASAAPKLLREAAPRVVEFVLSRCTGDGGFRGRGEESDLYYTVFGTDCLEALGADRDRDALRAFLSAFGDGGDLDFVNLVCLARCWASLPESAVPRAVRYGILEGIERFRTPDGGYRHAAAGDSATPYGNFLALGAYEDLEGRVPDAGALRASFRSLKAEDGAYANGPGLTRGLTPATAAAVTALAHLGEPADREAGSWLLARCHREGGFFAVQGAPVPDLLSTATALHALVCLGMTVDVVRKPCIDFVESLWSPEGGFHGTWADLTPDCEYTYYGLLALGHLAGGGSA
jgi:hypothetical protein